MEYQCEDTKNNETTFDYIQSDRKIDIITFFFIFLTSSYVVARDVVPSSIVIFIWILILGYLVFHSRFVPKKAAFIPVLICAMYIFLYAVRENDIIVGIKNLFGLVAASFYIFNFNINQIRDSIIRVVKFITIISLVCFASYLLIPQLNSLLVINKEGISYSCLGIYVHMVGYSRNCGMFWEPGAFQAFINVALLLEISKKEPKYSTMLIFCIGVLTTFSKTGYVAVLIMLIIYILTKTDLSTSGLGKLLILGLMVFVVLFAFKDRIFGSSQNTVFGKINTFFEYEEFNNTRRTSASARYFALKKPFEVFTQNPILGVGSQKLKELTYSYTLGNLTCTFVNWLAMYGILYGGIILAGYYKISSYLFNKRIVVFLCFINFFVITMSEDFSINPFFYIIPFMAYAVNKES